MRKSYSKWVKKWKKLRTCLNEIWQIRVQEIFWISSKIDKAATWYQLPNSSKNTVYTCHNSFKYSGCVWVITASEFFEKRSTKARWESIRWHFYEFVVRPLEIFENDFLRNMCLRSVHCLLILHFEIYLFQ